MSTFLTLCCNELKIHFSVSKRGPRFHTGGEWDSAIGYAEPSNEGSCSLEVKCHQSTRHCIDTHTPFLHMLIVSIHKRQTEMTLVTYISMSQYKKALKSQNVCYSHSQCDRCVTWRYSQKQLLVFDCWLEGRKASLYYRGAGLNACSQMHWSVKKVELVQKQTVKEE